MRMTFTGAYLQKFLKWQYQFTSLLPCEHARIITSATFCRSQAEQVTEMGLDILYSQHQKRSTVLGEMPVQGEGGYFGFWCTFEGDELIGLKNAWLWWGTSGSAWVTGQQTLHVVLLALTWPAFYSHKSQAVRRKRRRSRHPLPPVCKSPPAFRLFFAFSTFQSILS